MLAESVVNVTKFNTYNYKWDLLHRTCHRLFGSLFVAKKLEKVDCGNIWNKNQQFLPHFAKLWKLLTFFLPGRHRCCCCFRFNFLFVALWKFHSFISQQSQDSTVASKLASNPAGLSSISTVADIYWRSCFRKRTEAWNCQSVNRTLRRGGPIGRRVVAVRPRVP